MKVKFNYRNTIFNTAHDGSCIGNDKMSRCIVFSTSTARFYAWIGLWL